MLPESGSPGPDGGSDPARAVLAALLGIALAVGLAELAWREVDPPQPAPLTTSGIGLEPLAFDGLPGWAEDDHAAALAVFRRSCEAGAGKTGTPLSRACARSLRVDGDGQSARLFFERNFVPYEIESDRPGLLTAYYEPVVDGSRTQTAEFATPLYALPEGHVVLDDANRPQALDPTLVAGRHVAAAITAYPTRGEIEEGAMAEELRPIVYLENPVEAFFVHVQGSTRVRLPDGGLVRIAYAGKNGHPYASIGRHMREAGIRPEAGLGMRGIRDYLLANPEEAREIMAVNRSYIFFRELDDLPAELGPIGAEGLPLTPMRSLAVDTAFHDYGLPIYVEAELGGGTKPFRGLAIAQDTGSAIKGAARGDLFWGTGPEAGEAAGQVQAPARFVVLLPI